MIESNNMKLSFTNFDRIYVVFILFRYDNNNNYNNNNNAGNKASSIYDSVALVVASIRTLFSNPQYLEGYISNVQYLLSDFHHRPKTSSLKISYGLW